MKLNKGKLGFIQYPCDIGHCTYWSDKSFLKIIYNVDTFYFPKVQWRGYDPHGNFATLCKKLKDYMVSHEPNLFEDEIIDALNNGMDLIEV